jgi:hypothetical protein
MEFTKEQLKAIIINYNAQFNAEELPVNRLSVPDDVLAIMATIIDSQSHSCDIDSPDDIIEALESLRDNQGESDFMLEFDGNEYRLIGEDAIWDIYVDSIKEIVEDCYDLKLNNMPDFVAFSIDWEQTASNAYADGYGHTFSGYDGSEEEAGKYYIFRTN